MRFIELADDNYYHDFDFVFYSSPPHTMLDFIRFLIYSILLSLLLISQFDYNDDFKQMSYSRTHIVCVCVCMFGLLIVLCTMARVE